MKRNEIKAKVRWDWDAKAKRMKFAKGARVKWVCTYKYDRQCTKHLKDTGEIIAVTCVDKIGDDGLPNIRDPWRMYTRYYVEFDDGDVVGCHSHHLKRVAPPVEFGDWK